MESYAANNRQEKIEQPFSSEHAPIETIKGVEIKGHKLFVNGVESDAYKYVGNLQVQKNGIAGFQPDTEADSQKEFIDPAFPDRKFPTIIKKNGEIFVEGFHWNSLNKKEIYMSGLLGFVDPVTESVVFQTKGKYDSEESQVVVNNVPWKNNFNNVVSVESYNGSVVAVAKKLNSENSLYVNDREWVWDKNKKDGHHSDYINDALTNGNGVVVGTATSLRSGKGREHVFVGDVHGSKHEWKTSFDINHNKPHKIAVDKNSETVAVVGDISEVPTLVVNDVVCKLSSDPHNVQILRVEDGVVFVQYVNAIGKQYAEKISLNENANEVQEQNENNRKLEEALYIIRQLLSDAKTTPHEIVQMSLKYAELRDKYEESEKKANKVFALENEINTLKSENKTLKDSLDLSHEKNTELNEQIDQIKFSLNEVDVLLTELAPTKGGLLSKNKGMPEEMHTKFHTALKKKKPESEKKRTEERSRSDGNEQNNAAGQPQKSYKSPGDSWF